MTRISTAGSSGQAGLSSLYVLAASLFTLRFGATMTAVGLPLLVLHRYGAGLDAGVTLSLEILPSVLFGPAVGALIDRSDPRWFAIGGPLLAAPGTALLAKADTLRQIQLLAVLVGVGYMIGLPARMALRSFVIPEGLETKGNGLLIAAQRLPTLLGPGAAALLVPAGYSTLFLVDAGCAVLAAIIQCGLPAYPRSTVPTVLAAAEPTGFAALVRRLLTSLADVIAAVRADRALAALVGTSFAYMFGFGLTRLFLAQYSLIRFPDRTWVFGLLTAAMGSGAVVGSVVTARLNQVPQGLLYLAVNVCESCCWLVVAHVHSAGLAVVALALVGLWEAIGTVVFFTEAQLRLPKDAQGRFFGMLLPASDGCFVLGTMTAGVVVGTGITTAGWIIAAAIGVPMLVCGRLFVNRELWRRRRPDSQGPR